MSHPWKVRHGLEFDWSTGPLGHYITRLPHLSQLILHLPSHINSLYHTQPDYHLFKSLHHHAAPPSSSAQQLDDYQQP
jgi:hypothetical protein